MFIFFLLNKYSGLSFNSGVLIFMLWSNFEGFMASLDSDCHILYKPALENVNHLLQWNCNPRVVLYIVFKLSFLLLSLLSPSTLSSLGFCNFQRSSPVTFFLLNSFWLVLSCGLTKAVTETSVQCRKEAWVEVVNQIMSWPCMDWKSVRF